MANDLPRILTPEEEAYLAKMESDKRIEELLRQERETRDLTNKALEQQLYKEVTPEKQPNDLTMQQYQERISNLKRMLQQGSTGNK